MSSVNANPSGGIDGGSIIVKSAINEPLKIPPGLLYPGVSLRRLGLGDEKFNVLFDIKDVEIFQYVPSANTN